MSSIVVPLLAVAAGGFCGGLTRWALSKLNTGTRHTGTWAANVIGSVVLGFSIGMPGLLPIAVGTGFAGATSTWSTLAGELGTMLKLRRWRQFATYAALTAATTIVAAYLGTVYSARVFG